MGFAYVASGPLVRSSYKAGEFFMSAMLDEPKVRNASLHLKLKCHEAYRYSNDDQRSGAPDQDQTAP